MTASHESRHARAAKVIPGGVNSPVRAFQSVGGAPVFIRSAKGPRITDADGREYIDFVGSWGPMILGHAFPPVIEAVVKAAESGTSFGACTEAETEMAEAVRDCVPSVEKVRLVCSGTEATMSAVRLARGYTGREKIVKFRGCYHGHGDSFLIQAGSGALTFGNPSSPGVTKGSAQDTLLAEYNDLESVRALFKACGDEIAAVIVEPVAGNMGVLIPEKGFLEGLRALCDGRSTLLIFDEVITGFRLGLAGAQGFYGVRADLTTLGKILGGGLPLAAYGGRADIMDHLSPVGPVYQAGTLAGNPLATAAGLAMLREVRKPGFYEALHRRAAAWEADLRVALGEASIPWCINRVGSLLTVFFAAGPVRDYRSALTADAKAYGRFFHAMLDQGVYLAPSQFEAAFLSAAHDDAVLAQSAAAVKKAIAALNG
ncbi:MAG TPA: glutamate-1-semialdehyde 2,1-aminomutase [Fibrobacteria bacterium]|nr:glutamate-1-semialdehyde 2,1-aminomutase [Fibrobacteria bacterium]